MHISFTLSVDEFIGLVKNFGDCAREVLTKLFCSHCDSKGAKRLIFSDVNINNQFKIRGDIQMIELRKNQFVDLTATPDGDYQKGSEVWTESNEFVSVEPVPDDAENPLRRRVTALQKEQTGSVTVQLAIDGDPDDDEARPLLAVETFVINNSEARTLEFTSTPPQDV